MTESQAEAGTRPAAERWKVVVDRDKCVSLGICEGLAPDVFLLNDDGELEVDESVAIDGVDLEMVRSAVSGCPVNALRLAGA